MLPSGNVYDLSRLARDDFDALWLLAEIEKHGAKLESTLERIDNSPAGRLLYALMAGVNAFRSRKALVAKKESTGTAASSANSTNWSGRGSANSLI